MVSRPTPPKQEVVFVPRLIRCDTLCWKIYEAACPPCIHVLFLHIEALQVSAQIATKILKMQLKMHLLVPIEQSLPAS